MGVGAGVEVGPDQVLGHRVHALLTSTWKSRCTLTRVKVGTS